MAKYDPYGDGLIPSERWNKVRQVIPSGNKKRLVVIACIIFGAIVLYVLL